MKENLEQYIKDSHTRVLNEQKEFTIFNNIPVYLNEDLPENVDIRVVLNTISEAIPVHLTNNIESIQIGHIEQFTRKETNALYKEGTMYVTNYQDNNEDMIDDIVHEIAHATEELFTRDIYKDKKVENEFLGKRSRLYSLMRAEGIKVYESSFLETRYSKEFDYFLYKEVGYERLGNIATGLFSSPYAITSLREYFATGFEEYYIGDRNYLKKISPSLYNTLIYLDGLKY